MTFFNGINNHIFVCSFGFVLLHIIICWSICIIGMTCVPVIDFILNVKYRKKRSTKWLWIEMNKCECARANVQALKECATTCAHVARSGNHSINHVKLWQTKSINEPINLEFGYAIAKNKWYGLLHWKSGNVCEPLYYLFFIVSVQCTLLLPFLPTFTIIVLHIYHCNYAIYVENRISL